MIRLLIYLRYLAVLGQLLAVLVVTRTLDLHLPLPPLYLTMVGLLAFNLLAHWQFRDRTEATSTTLIAHLCVDLLALTVMLYFTGGPANPFVSLYLVPVALAAIALQVGPMLGVSLLSGALYTFLMFRHVPLPHAHAGDFDLHVTGMWVNFLLSAAIMVAVLGRFMVIVRNQRLRLAEARERALRDESLLALGTLAAGTAHELNTPLTTMGLLIDSMASDPKTIEIDDLETLSIQIARCREHVRTLADLARHGAMGKPHPRPVAAFVRDCLARWQLLRPGVLVEAHFDDSSERTELLVDPTLPQALINLLDNAADACESNGVQEQVTVEVTIGPGQADVRILDHGPGPSRAAAAVEGGSRRKGLGIGLLISNASFERVGGRVSQHPRPGGGCVTVVVIPIGTANQGQSLP
ncbi:MAG TPA: two-component sensor histidine kinase [Xanthomonadales bacterium]|nr:two-component sensor histidine kinase [Xanthomonadales bacterium]